MDNFFVFTIRNFILEFFNGFTCNSSCKKAAVSKIFGWFDFEELMRGVVEINEGCGLLSAKSD